MRYQILGYLVWKFTWKVVWWAVKQRAISLLPSRRVVALATVATAVAALAAARRDTA